MSAYTIIRFTHRASLGDSESDFKANQTTNYQQLRPAILALPGVYGMTLSQDSLTVNYYENMITEDLLRAQVMSIIMKAMRRRGSKLFPDYKAKRTDPSGVFYLPKPSRARRKTRVRYSVSVPTFLYREAGLTNKQRGRIKRKIAREIADFDGVSGAEVYLAQVIVQVETAYISRSEARRRLRENMLDLFEDSRHGLVSDVIFPFAADKGITSETLKVKVTLVN